MNRGAPAWSDEFRCAEWSWLNGVVDAMAFGNHDVDYGRAELDRCRKSITYPILSANTEGFPRHAVFAAGGARIGVFALAGPDFEQLGVATLLAEPDSKPSPFSDTIAAARHAVRFLREVEKVDAVVLIGHQHQEEDYRLAREVPGIDVIFGSHSHLKRDLTQIEGTRTWFISPGQYLSFISRVELTVRDGKVVSNHGGLVPVDPAMKEDRTIARRVRRMQRRLENDPEHRALFLPIATLPAAISTDALAGLALETMRAVADADLAISTTSSFRRPLPDGNLNLELLRGAMPYDNEIVTCTMSGAQWQEVVRTAGAESYVAAPGVIDPARSYTVATTDYMAFVAYKDVFACEKKRTGLRVRDELRKRQLTTNN